jgi:hypothetical protein
MIGEIEKDCRELTQLNKIAKKNKKKTLKKG